MIFEKKNIKADSLYFNGDSWTYGSGLPEKERLTDFFPRLISDNLKLPLYCSAQPGSSNQRILRTTIEDIINLKDQGKSPFVIISWSKIHRFELFCRKENEYQQIITPNDDSNPKIAKDLWANHSNEIIDLLQSLINFISLDAFLEKLNIPCLFFLVFPIHTKPLEANEVKSYYNFILKNFLLNNRHQIRLSFEDYLKSYPDVKWNDTFHPLQQGHKYLSEFILDHINSRFNFIKAD